MAARPPCLADSNSREISLSLLPNEDGSNPHQEYYSDQSLQQQQTPPTTLSCAQCERIVGDSSAFLFVTRQMGTVTLDRMVSVEIGTGGLKTSPEGEWDEFWYGGHVTPPARGRICVEWRLWKCSNFKDISCGKCAAPLGKMYFATTSKLSPLQSDIPSLFLSSSSSPLTQHSVFQE